MKPFTLATLLGAGLPVTLLTQHEGQESPFPGSGEGLGRAHMQTSCAPTVGVDLDRALALLHNFWYARALERVSQVAKNDPECAMAYWGAVMTHHPFWDPPSQADPATRRCVAEVPLDCVHFDAQAKRQARFHGRAVRYRFVTLPLTKKAPGRASSRSVSGTPA